MKLRGILLVLLCNGADGVMLRAHKSVSSIQQNTTEDALPYVLDRCTEVTDVFGNADYMGKEPMTLNTCYTFCTSRKAFYFGVYKGKECWCGSQYQARVGGSTYCNVPCPGNDKEMCGGSTATSVYIIGDGPCGDEKEETPGDSDDKNLIEADQALDKVMKEAKKVVAKKNKKYEIKGAKRMDEAKRALARAKEDIASGDESAAKKKLKIADTKVKKAKEQFDKMKSVGEKPSTREQQAEQDLKMVKKVLKDAEANPSAEVVKKADKLLNQAAAKPPPKRANVCLNMASVLKSFEFMGLHDRFLRHEGFRLKASENSDDDLFKNDATFEIMPPLLASADCGISLRSQNFPENYLRHTKFELHLDKEQDSDLFKTDATFFAIAAEDSSLTGAYLLRSANFPDRYIHVRGNGEAYLDQLTAGKEKEFSFKIVAPLMSAFEAALESRRIITRNAGDWTEQDCEGGGQVIGGGCDAQKGPYKMQFSGPEGQNAWKCGGHGGEKKVWVMCSKDLKRQIIQKDGGDWTVAKCPAGQKVMSGGCNAKAQPYIMQYNGPEGDSAWKCGGHGGPKTVWAICTAEEARIAMKEKKGGDWVTVRCDDGKRAIGGGCNAYNSPHIFQKNGPTGKYFTKGGKKEYIWNGWKCGGHGGPKHAWVICEA